MNNKKHFCWSVVKKTLFYAPANFWMSQIFFHGFGARMRRRGDVVVVAAVVVVVVVAVMYC